MTDLVPSDEPGELAPQSPPEAAAEADPAGIDVSRMPGHAGRLLKIRVPVTVSLAAQRKPIQEIIELGPGSIVKFDKTCDELLELAVGDRAIASGEVVKVGDKFGLRIRRLLSN